ncbi:MAG: oligosaccharide flippase family protein [Rhodospirillales bacterium]
MTLPRSLARLLALLGVEHRYILVNGAGVILARAGGAALVMLVTVLVTRALGVEDYGRFAFLLSVAFLAVLFGGLGLPVAANRLLPRYRQRRRDGKGNTGGQFLLVGGAVVFAGSLMAAVAAVEAIRSFPAAGNLLPFPLWAIALYVSATAMISFLAPACRALDRPTTAALVDNIYPRLIILAGIGLFAVLGRALTLDSLLVLWAVAGWGTVAVALVALFRHPEVVAAAGRRLRARQVRVWLSLSTTMMITPVFYFVLSETDILCLGFFSDPADVGLYNVARRLAELMQFAYVAVNTLLLPRIAAAHAARDASRMQAIVDTMNVLVLIPATLVLVVLAAGGRTILSLFGAEFAQGWIVVLMLVVPRFIDLVLGPASEVLMMTGDQGRVARINIAAGVANLGLNLLLVPAWGAIGAATATAVTMIGWKSVLFVLCRRRIPVQTCLLARLGTLWHRRGRPAGGGPAPERSVGGTDTAPAWEPTVPQR